MLTKFRLTSSLENFCSSNILLILIKLSFRPGNVHSHGKTFFEAWERQIAEMVGLGTALPCVPNHFNACGEIICNLLQVSSKCSALESSVAVYSDPHLMLFVRLKSTSLLSVQSSASSLSSSSVAAQTSQPQALELPQVSEADKYTKHVKLPKSSDSDNADVDGGDAGAHWTAKEAVIDEIKTLLWQWLPVHSLPDDVEVVKYIPFTKHGRFPSSYYHRRRHHHPGWPLILESP